jgi:SAM-dependent methyltransferase
METLPPVLDPACGGRMMYFDKSDGRVLFCDIRRGIYPMKNRSDFHVAPDVVQDFTAMLFEDNTFHLVVFDPPHLKKLGERSYLSMKYGRLDGDWRDTIRQGFSECFRVLRPNGTLIFKWAEVQIPLAEVLSLTEQNPLFGQRDGRRGNTHWIVFIKDTATTKPEGEV